MVPMIAGVGRRVSGERVGVLLERALHVGGNDAGPGRHARRPMGRHAVERLGDAHDRGDCVEPQTQVVVLERLELGIPPADRTEHGGRHHQAVRRPAGRSPALEDRSPHPAAARPRAGARRPRSPSTSSTTTADMTATGAGSDDSCAVAIDRSSIAGTRTSSSSRNVIHAPRASASPAFLAAAHPAGPLVADHPEPGIVGGRERTAGSEPSSTTTTSMSDSVCASALRDRSLCELV